MRLLWLLPLVTAQTRICNSFTRHGLDFALQIKTSNVATVTPGLLDTIFREQCLQSGANETFCANAAEQRALYNLEYTGPPLTTSNMWADFQVEVDTSSPWLQFSSKKSADTTSWFVIKWDTNSVRCVSTTLCDSPFFRLQPILFKMAFTVSASTFLSDTLDLKPDFLYHSTFTKAPSRLVRMSTASTRTAGNAALWTQGCSLPVLTLRVQYVPSEEAPLGYATSTLNQKGMVNCLRRTIFLFAVTDSQSPPMACHVPLMSNTIRRHLEQQGDREKVLQILKNEDYARSASPTVSKSLRVCTTHAQNLLDCSQPPSPNAIGGVWKDSTRNKPGYCAPCTAVNIHASLQHQRIRACNRTLPNEKSQDCCLGCQTGYMLQGTACVLECKPNYAFDGITGSCTKCPMGTYSMGAADTCRTCTQRGYSNARIDSLFGCQPCDRRYLAVLDRCVQCPPYHFVPAGSSTCITCSSLGAYFLPTLSPTPSQCQACAPGTYMYAPSVTICQACPLSTYTDTNASLQCKPCPLFTFSAPNRTTCMPCPPINTILLPFTQYYQPGTCATRCKLPDSYQLGDPNTQGGCKSCASVTLPAGHYADPTNDCSIPRPCTNAPSSNAIYTAPAPKNSRECPFRCVAGYTLQNNNKVCQKCTYPSSYNATIHIPVLDSTDCTFDCRPPRYRDGTCQHLCMELKTLENIQIFPLVSDYLGKQRPHFVIGRCGFTDRIPQSPLPFLRKAWWAYLKDYTTHECGNSLLETDEECDDGNTHNGDGCTSSCRLETNAYWDCDLIGSPCLPHCGWPTTGYLLPACGQTCQCTNLSYTHFLLHVPVGQRVAWMRTHLVSCDCIHNPLRVIPFAQCTLQNRGCRECPPSYYHDDLKATCRPCGSACSPGYTPGNTQECSTFYSTSNAAREHLSIAQEQLHIGCVPCPLQSFVPHYIAQCQFMCYRDAVDTSNDTYCSQSPNGSICSGTCLSCTQSYSNTARTPRIGHYITECQHVHGHTWAPCDPASKPTWAEFTTASTYVGASTGCDWACPPNTLFTGTGCIPCTTQQHLACKSGQTIKTCASRDMYTCVPCTGATDFPLQIWTSVAPSWTCQADCEPQTSFSLTVGDLCEPCTPRTCALGQLYVPCTPRTDTECQTCQLSLPLHAEYVAAGSCDYRCISGYYASSDSQCSPCTIICNPGFYPSSTCQQPSQRLTPPTCIPCPHVLLPEQAWKSEYSPWAQPCELICKSQYVMIGNNCTFCTPSLCALGQRATCLQTTSYGTTLLQCDACAPLTSIWETYVSPGSCATQCVPQAVRNGLFCQPALPPTPPSTPILDNRPGLIYPERNLKHSAMK